jgi:hypothetical protein
MRSGPVPADPGRDGPRSGWEPVITRPDPMPAEEWRAWLECEPAEGMDPEAYPDEDEFGSPDAVEFTEAELAVARRRTVATMQCPPGRQSGQATDTADSGRQDAMEQAALTTFRQVRGLRP